MIKKPKLLFVEKIGLSIVVIAGLTGVALNLYDWIPTPEEYILLLALYLLVFGTPLAVIMIYLSILSDKLSTLNNLYRCKNEECNLLVRDYQILQGDDGERKCPSCTQQNFIDMTAEVPILSKEAFYKNRKSFRTTRVIKVEKSPQ